LYKYNVTVHTMAN